MSKDSLTKPHMSFGGNCQYPRHSATTAGETWSNAWRTSVLHKTSGWVCGHSPDVYTAAWMHMSRYSHLQPGSIPRSKCSDHSLPRCPSAHSRTRIMMPVIYTPIEGLPDFGQDLQPNVTPADRLVMFHAVVRGQHSVDNPQSFAGQPMQNLSRNVTPTNRFSPRHCGPGLDRCSPSPPHAALTALLSDLSIQILEQLSFNFSTIVDSLATLVGAMLMAINVPLRGVAGHLAAARSSMVADRRGALLCWGWRSRHSACFASAPPPPDEPASSTPGSSQPVCSG